MARDDGLDHFLCLYMLPVQSLTGRVGVIESKELDTDGNT